MVLHAPLLKQEAPHPQKLYHMMTWGCQMNVYDSQRMEDLLGEEHYRSTPTPENADLIILNTCHIRDKATEKIFSELGRLKKIKDRRAKEGLTTHIAVTGCVAQAQGEELLKRVPYVDLILGPQTYHLLPNFLKKVEQNHEPIVETQFLTQEKFDTLSSVKHEQSSLNTAFVTIQEGCDKFCRFCVVPYTRGAEISRGAPSIIQEIRKLAQQGAKEITLLGQNVNAWHQQDEQGRRQDLAALIGQVADTDGITRIRYTTSHPRDMNAALINAHRDIPKLMPFLHLPVQSGSDKILKSMNRGHTAAEYLATIEALRSGREDMAFSSDFIVGFPGESDEDFEATLDLVKKVGFAQSYSFKYSPRPGTPAWTLEDHVPEEVKDKRLARLQELLRFQQDAFNEKMVGQEIDVLFTSKGRKDGQIVGRSPWLQPVHIYAPSSLIGQEKTVKITMCIGHSLAGVLAS